MFGCGNRAATLLVNPAVNNSDSPNSSKCSLLVSWAYFIVCSATLLIAGGGAAAAAPGTRPQHQKNSDLPEGFAIDVKASEADVTKAVQYIIQDQIIHGTQVYAREDELTDAEPATSSPYYGTWTAEGHVFYKIRRDALAPRHFKNSTDVGIITVRYIVLGVGPN